MSVRSLAVVAGMLLAAVAPPAQATGPTYYGGCTLNSSNGRTRSGLLGPSEDWTGTVRIDVVPSTSGVPTGESVTVWCELRINGVSHGTVLGPVSGVGVVVAATPIRYQAPVTDIVQVCEHVATAAGTVVGCPDAIAMELTPQVLWDASDLVACTAFGGDAQVGSHWLYDCPTKES